MGTFLEELGSKDYSALKTYEEKANTIENKQEIGSLEENPDRSRLTIYLTLLRSKNSSVAAVFHDVLDDYMQNFIETGQIRQPGHRVAIQEYMLLLILAVSHPAFSIEQKEKLRHLFDTIQDEVNLSPQVCSVTLFGASSRGSSYSLIRNSVQMTNGNMQSMKGAVQLKFYRKTHFFRIMLRRHMKHHQYILLGQILVHQQVVKIDQRFIDREIQILLINVKRPK